MLAHHPPETGEIEENKCAAARTSGHNPSATTHWRDINRHFAASELKSLTPSGELQVTPTTSRAAAEGERGSAGGATRFYARPELAWRGSALCPQILYRAQRTEDFNTANSRRTLSLTSTQRAASSPRTPGGERADLLIYLSLSLLLQNEAVGWCVTHHTSIRWRMKI